jgi:hypothetical protein
MHPPPEQEKRKVLLPTVELYPTCFTVFLFSVFFSMPALPEGETPFQFYSLATPHGQKPAILLEELGIDYDAHKIMIDGEQFTSGFVEICPNSKIPAALDKEGVGGKPIRLFESGELLISPSLSTLQLFSLPMY